MVILKPTVEIKRKSAILYREHSIIASGHVLKVRGRDGGIYLAIQ
jgi:hypothetical protein